MSEFKKFDKAMGTLLKVSHAELKAKLDADKAAKDAKPKGKRKNQHDRGN